MLGESPVRGVQRGTAHRSATSAPRMAVPESPIRLIRARMRIASSRGDFLLIPHCLIIASRSPQERRGSTENKVRRSGLFGDNEFKRLHRNTPENKLTISFVSCDGLYFHKSGILKWDKVNEEKKKGERQKLIWKQSKCVLTRWHVCAVSFFLFF